MNSNLLSSVCVGSIDHYIQRVNAIPLLSPEEEIRLTNALFYNNDTNSAKVLVYSHLRLVVSIARNYLGYGLPQSDIIQEGNIGLMKAVKKFNPKFNVRLVTYAIHWIKAEIHEYILKNWRLVRIASTKAQRKLFFKLRSLLPQNSTVLSTQTVKDIAAKLEVKHQDVIDMHKRFLQTETSLDEENNDDDENSINNNSIAYRLSDNRYEPCQNIIDMQTRVEHEKVTSALEKLKDKDVRMYDIINTRWINYDKKITLKELATKWKVSIERVRQIESQAIKYIKDFVSS